MTSCGLDRETGLPLYDLDHVAQHVETLFTTRLGDLIMARGYGAGVSELLGRRVTPTLVSGYKALLALGVDTWEPRLKVVRIEAAGNTANAVTLGALRFQVMASYRPRGHLGDLTVEGGLNRFGLAVKDARLRFTFDRVA